MGIKKQVKRIKDDRDLLLMWDGAGKLIVYVKDTSPQYRNKPVIFSINGDQELIHLDGEGMAVVEFDKSEPAVMYQIKIKNVGSLKNDQRLAFSY